MKEPEIPTAKDLLPMIARLQSRVKDLEDAQRKIRSAPESPLVERVADAIATEATSAGIINDRPARAAILEVAAWMRENDTGHNAVRWLEMEADPHSSQEGNETTG